jgi:hypothetical protein
VKLMVTKMGSNSTEFELPTDCITHTCVVG